MDFEIKKLSFCKLYLYRDYASCVMNEGVTVTDAYSKAISDIASDHFKGRPFVYISHRVYSYAVDPTSLNYTNLLDNLIGFAVVSKHHAAVSIANVESTFVNKPFKIFRDMPEALVWARQLLEKQKSA